MIRDQFCTKNIYVHTNQQLMGLLGFGLLFADAIFCWQWHADAAVRYCLSDMKGMRIKNRLNFKNVRFQQLILSIRHMNLFHDPFSMDVGNEYWYVQ